MNAARSALLAHRNVTGLARSPANAGGTAFAFLGSTLTSSSTGALSGAMSVAIVSQILEAIPAFRHPRRLPPAHGWHARENPLSNPRTPETRQETCSCRFPLVIIFFVLVILTLMQRTFAEKTSAH